MSHREEAERILDLVGNDGWQAPQARYLGAALLLFVVGFGFYCVAIAQLLMAQPAG